MLTWLNSIDRLDYCTNIFRWDCGRGAGTLAHNHLSLSYIPKRRCVKKQNWPFVPKKNNKYEPLSQLNKVGYMNLGSLYNSILSIQNNFAYLLSWSLPLLLACRSFSSVHLVTSFEMHHDISLGCTMC